MNDAFKNSRLILSAALSCSLFACTHNTPAPVSELVGFGGQQQSTLQDDRPEFYIVKPGDTLFSIAWYYSLDHRELAKINQLSSNTIYPGQKLALRRKIELPYFDPESLILALNQEVLKRPVSYSPSRQTSSNTASSRQKSLRSRNSSRTAALKIATSSIKQHTGSHHSQIEKAVDNNRASTQIVRKVSKLHFIWPAEGKIIERFSSRNDANRGLDIAAHRGQAVRATAPGRVVYKGNGLRGYGNLVIIKHDDDYLSAYAHNEKIHVAENEFVKAGQRIADIGSSGTQIEKLHFEIRYKGKPVDPLNYLPQK